MKGEIISRGFLLEHAEKIGLTKKGNYVPEKGLEIMRKNRELHSNGAGFAKNIEDKSAHMRFAKEDILFDPDLTAGNNEGELVGYLWATDALVSLAGGFTKQNDDDYINLYPVWNEKTDEFYVIRSATTEQDEPKISLTETELDFIKKEFMQYYKLELEQNEPKLE